jgi:hypothetical protein
MGFIYTNEGNYIPLSDVQSARPTPDDTVRLELRGGDRATVSGRFWNEALQLHGGSSFPAGPGYFRLESTTDEDDQRVINQEPVIGWVVSTMGSAIPVTAQGIDLNLRSVLVPDGRVIAGDGWHDNLEAWKAQWA